jgi:hypothetical protein
MALLAKMGTGVLLFAALFVVMAMVMSSCSAAIGIVIFFLFAKYIFIIYMSRLLADGDLWIKR